MVYLDRDYTRDTASYSLNTEQFSTENTKYKTDAKIELLIDRAHKISGRSNPLEIKAEKEVTYFVPLSLLRAQAKTVVNTHRTITSLYYPDNLVQGLFEVMQVLTCSRVPSFAPATARLRVVENHTTRFFLELKEAKGAHGKTEQERDELPLEIRDKQILQLLKALPFKGRFEKLSYKRGGWLRNIGEDSHVEAKYSF